MQAVSSGSQCFVPFCIWQVIFLRLGWRKKAWFQSSWEATRVCFWTNEKSYSTKVYPRQWIYWQGKNMSFKHLVNTDPPVETNSKVTSMQTTVKKVMSVKKKSFFPEKPRLKSSMNGIVLSLCYCFCPHSSIFMK